MKNIDTKSSTDHVNARPGASVAAGILIVEDELPHALELAGMLESAGYRVWRAERPWADIGFRMDELKPDLVLMDIDLDDMVDGICLAAKAVARRVPVVFMTGCSGEETVARALTAAPYGYLVKPPHREELCSTIEAALCRHRLDENERAVRLRLDRIIETAPCGILECGADGAIERCNGFFRALTGYASDEVVGRMVWDFGADSGCRVRLADHMLKSGGPEAGLARERDLTLVCRDGGRMDARIAWSPPGGELPGFVVAVTDITAYNDIIKKLKWKDNELEMLMNNMPDLVNRCDLNGTLLFASPSHARVLGYEPGDMTGIVVFEYLHPDDRPAVTRALERGLKPGLTSEKVTCRVRARDGRYLWFDVISTLVVDENGFPSGLVNYARDITEEKERTDLMESLRKEKENLRTENIMREAIVRAVEEERRRIGRDLHDGLGQNLSAAMFIAEALRNGARGYGARRAGSLDRLLSVLEDASRQTRGISRLLCGIDVNASNFEEALGEFALYVKSVFGASCEIRRDRGFHVEEGEAEHLYYTVRESVNNAIRHGGATRLRVRLLMKDGTRGIVIRDNGSGFRDGVRGKGGMGMAIMQYRSRVMGVDFSARNHPDGGAVVEVIMEDGHGDRAR